jgi:hypothetical protein
MGNKLAKEQQKEKVKEAAKQNAKKSNEPITKSTTIKSKIL